MYAYRHEVADILKERYYLNQMKLIFIYLCNL